MNCMACQRCITEGNDSSLLTCVHCKGLYHCQCLGMTIDYYNTHIAGLMLSWICPGCDKVSLRRRDDTPTRKRFERHEPVPVTEIADMSYDDTTVYSSRLTECVESVVSMPPQPPSSGHGQHADFLHILQQINTEIKTLRAENKNQLENFKSDILSSITLKYREYDDKINSVMASLKHCTDSICNITKSYSDLESACSFITAQNDDFKKKLTTTQTDIKSLKTEIKNLKAKDNVITDLTARINDLEQRARISNIEVFGIPENKSEDLNQLIVKLSENLGVKLTGEDIDFVTRIQPKIKTSNSLPKPIVAKLTSARIRDKLISAIRKTQGLTSADLGVKGKPTTIYINEHLTPDNKHLFKLARVACKEADFRYVWVRNGTIRVRRGDTSPVIIIKTASDIKKIISGGQNM